MNENIKYKQKEALFKVEGINQVWEEILHLAKIQVIPRKTEVCSLTEDYFYYLISGSIKVSCLSANGQERAVMHIGKGSLFSEILHLHVSHLHTNSLQTIEDCSVAAFKKELIETDTFYREYPHIARNLVHSIGIKAGVFFSQLFDSGITSIESRTCRFLLQLWNESGKESSICPDMTQNEIATALNIHRSSLCRVIDNLRNEGIISKFTKKELVIISPEKLAQKAN